MTLSIQTFGAVRVALDDKPLELPASRKTRALLAYLALSGTWQSRSRLCEIFWRLPDDPRGSLRWTLSKLRHVLNADGRKRLLTQRERVMIDTEAIALDFREVDACVSDDNASEVELTRAGEQLSRLLLADCELPEQPIFTSWLRKQREDAFRLRVRLAKRMARSSGRPVEEVQVLTQRSLADTAQGLHGLPPELIGESGEPAGVAGPTIRFTQAEDCTVLAWTSVGSANNPPLVKAAQWLTHLEFDWDSPIGTPLLRDLGRAFRVIRYDNRGFGLSDWNPPVVSFGMYVADLERVVDAAGVERFPLLGMGHGGAVAVEYAARHPERVSHLILFGAFATAFRHTCTPEQMREYEALIVLTELGWGQENPTYRLMCAHALIPGADASELQWLDELQRRSTSPRGAAQCMEASSWIDVRARLSQVRAPTLVLHSRGDRICPFASGRDMASGIPNAKFIELDSDNHMLLGREPAARDFVRAVRRFILDDQSDPRRVVEPHRP